MKRIQHLYQGKYLSRFGLEYHKGRRFVGSHKSGTREMQEWRGALLKESGLMFCFRRNTPAPQTRFVYRMQKGEQKFIGNRKFMYRKKRKRKKK